MSAPAPGMTSRKTTQREPAATDSAMKLQHFNRVHTARRLKSTMPAHKASERALIQPHQQDQRRGGHAVNQ